ncbi:MAG: hypothetical protein Q9203_005327 [Teloschistes exilis]
MPLGRSPVFTQIARTSNQSSPEDVNGQNIWISILGLTSASSLVVKRLVVSPTPGAYLAINEKYIANTGVRKLVTCALTKTANVALGRDFPGKRTCRNISDESIVKSQKAKPICKRSILRTSKQLLGLNVAWGGLMTKTTN